MTIREIESALEAILFASGEPVTVEALCGALELDAKTLTRVADHLAESYEERESGLRIFKLSGSYQMGTSPQFEAAVRGALDIRRNTRLSPAAFEVLAVVAYRQPVTRAFIEQVRGVDCGGPIGSLLEKNLIEEKGRMELPGRPLLYGTTKDFLRCFSLRSLEDLPPLHPEEGIWETEPPEGEPESDTAEEGERMD